MPKARPYQHGDKQGQSIRCPGCNTWHCMVHHGFNGDWEKPTFTPSILVHWGDGTKCHSYVVDGRINFLEDSNFHSLRGWHDLPESNHAD